MTTPTSTAEGTQKGTEKSRLQYEREKLLELRTLDAATVRPSALTQEFFREQRDGEQLWSPEAWMSARTQNESGDAGSTQQRERGSSIVLGPGASRRNWSSGCGTQQGGMRNREASSTDTPSAQQDDTRSNGTFRSGANADRDGLRFRERGEFSATRGGRFGPADDDPSFAGASRGRARGAAPVGAPSSFAGAARGRVRLDQDGLRKNQLFEGLVGSRGKEPQRGSDAGGGDSDRSRNATENDRDRSERVFDRDRNERGFDRDRNLERGFDRDRDRERDRDRNVDRSAFDRDRGRDFDRDRGAPPMRGGYRRDRDAPYNAALSGSTSTDSSNRFGGVRRTGRFDDEPEWMTGGPKDAFDCLELHGLPEDEERDRRGSEREEEVMEIGDDDDDYDDNGDALGDDSYLRQSSTSDKPPLRRIESNGGKSDSGAKKDLQPAVIKKDEPPSALKKTEIAKKIDPVKRDEPIKKSEPVKKEEFVRKAEPPKNVLLKKNEPAKKDEPPKKEELAKKSEPPKKPEASGTAKWDDSSPMGQGSLSAKAEDAKKDEANAQAKALDVDMSKLAGSRFVKWVQHSSEAAPSRIEITVVNTAANASTASTAPTKQAPPATASTNTISGTNATKPTAISVNDLFKTGPASGKQVPQAAAPVPAPPSAAMMPNGAKPGPVQVQELESALGVKNDDAANQAHNLNVLLASIGPVTNTNNANANAAAAAAAAAASPANRLGKPISFQSLFGGSNAPPTVEAMNAQRGAQMQATQSQNTVQAAQVTQLQSHAALTRPNSIYDARSNQATGGNAQSQLSDSVQRLFLAQQLNNANANIPQTAGALQQSIAATTTQKPVGASGGNGSRPTTPNFGAPPSGWPGTAPSANAPRTLNVNAANPNAARLPNAHTGAQASAPFGGQPQLPTPTTPTTPTPISSEQVANVVAQLTNLVLGKFNSSHTGSQQREQAAAAFSASVVQAAVQMFVNELLKSIDNPTKFIEHLSMMRSNLPNVIRQFVASGIDQQLAEQFLSTIISLAPYAVALLIPQAANASQLVAVAQQQVPATVASNSQLSTPNLREQLNTATMGHQLGAAANQQMQPTSLAQQLNSASFTQQHGQLGLAAQQAQLQQSFGALGLGSQMGTYAGHMMPPGATHMGTQAQVLGSTPTQPTGASFLSAAHQQQLIEASLAKRAAMNNSGQQQSNAFAHPATAAATRTPDFQHMASAEKRPILAASGQQFVPTQVLRQLASAPKATPRASDTDETGQPPAMRPITKASRDAVDSNSAAQASGQQFTNNPTMQQQLLMHRQALLAAMQGGALQATSKQ